MPYANTERQKQYTKERWKALKEKRKLAGIYTWFDEEYLWTRYDKPNEEACWIWKHKKNKQGYGVLRWRNKYWFAHRLAYYLHYKKLPSKYICHSCDNPACGNPRHLWEGTQADNMRDMISKGRGGNKGETNGQAKFTDAQIIEIRKYIEQFGDSVKTRKELIQMYSIHRSTLGDIILANTYRHLLEKKVE